MAKFYIVDTSQTKGGQSPVVLFNSTADVMSYLESVCKRRFGQTRKQFMYSVSELGFGVDDPEGRNFFDQMEQYFQVGVIRGDSTPVRCNIFDADKFSKTKEVHGN